MVSLKTVRWNDLRGREQITAQSCFTDTLLHHNKALFSPPATPTPNADPTDTDHSGTTGFCHYSGSQQIVAAPLVESVDRLHYYKTYPCLHPLPAPSTSTTRRGEVRQKGGQRRLTLRQKHGQPSRPCASQPLQTPKGLCRAGQAHPALPVHTAALHSHHELVFAVGAGLAACVARHVL